MSAWTQATDELVGFLAQQQLAKRQAMLDELTQADRARVMAREDSRDARADREEAAKIAEREAATAKLKTELERADTVRNLTGQRQASLNLAGSGDPTGAQATRDALAVALRVAGAGDVADAGAKADTASTLQREKDAALAAYEADPSDANARTLEVRYGVKVPERKRDPLVEYEEKKKIDRRYERPSEASQLAAEMRKLQLEEKKTKIEDAAAEKTAKADEARAITTDTLAGVRALATHPGLSTSQGVVSSRVQAPFSQAAQDYRAERDRIVAALTLPNLGALKGPMSDKDVAFVKQLATKLASDTLSDAATVQELKRLETFLESKLGGRRSGDDLGKDW